MPRTDRPPANLEFMFLRADVRVTTTLREIQSLVRKRLDPESEMTCMDFENAVMGLVDNADIEAAITEVEGP